jgi:hypothetical protein
MNCEISEANPRRQERSVEYAESHHEPSAEGCITVASITGTPRVEHGEKTET